MQWQVSSGKALVFLHKDVLYRPTFVTLVYLVAIVLCPHCGLIKPDPDDYNTFRRVYEVPILKSRAPDRTANELEIGEARSTQVCSLQRILSDRFHMT